MAAVLILSADLMFGSRLQAQLQDSGHELELTGDVARVRERLVARGGGEAAVLVVDLTDEALQGPAAIEALAREGVLAGTRTLAYYAHVDADARARARTAGFDLAVPRSRIAREAPELIERLLASTR